MQNEEIIFLELEYIPAQSEKEHLLQLQNWLQYTYATICYEEKENKFQKVIRVQNMANILRSKWKLLKGGSKCSEKSLSGIA